MDAFIELSIKKSDDTDIGLNENCLISNSFKSPQHYKKNKNDSKII